MKNVTKGNGSRSGKTRVVEIVGPAGAGKTTLYQALESFNETIRLGNFPDVHKAADASFFILNGFQLIPNLLWLYRPNSRQLTRREFAWMSILYGWSDLLQKESRYNNKVILLDQGPVYLLAEMWLFGPEYLRQKAAERLWQDLYDHWGNTLDMVIWLDAADDILLDRIRNRQQDHIVKAETVEVVNKFLDRYRTEYEYLLSILTTKNAGLKILKFDTRWQKPQDIVNQFMSELSC